MAPDQRPNLPFPTPQPNELQSEESKDAVRKRLAEGQGTETNIFEDQAKQEANLTDTAPKLEDTEHLADRHLPSLDSPPG